MLFEVILYVVTLWHCGASNSVYNNSRSIKNKLLKNYNEDSPPLQGLNQPLDVNTTFYIMALQELDEKSQILITTAFWIFNWQDEFLRWDNSKDSNVPKMTLKTKDIWTPDVFIVNDVNDMRLGYFSEKEYINVASSGNMKWFPTKELRTSCSVNLSNYPFDIQVCDIRMEAWYHDSKDFVLNVLGTGIEKSKSHFVENGEWEILNLSATSYQYSDYDENSTAYTGIHYSITLKRRPSYHVLTTAFPFMILVMLNLLSMTIPTECGEKLGFCMSQFLTMIVFLTLVAQSMHSSSFTISYFTILIGSQILVSGITIFVVAVSIHAQNQKPDEKPPVVMKFLFKPVHFVRHNLSKIVYDEVKIQQQVSSDQTVQNISWSDIHERINFVLKIVLIANVIVSITVFMIIYS